MHESIGTWMIQNLQYIIPILAIITFAASAKARHAVSRLLPKGQSLEALTAASAEQIATVQAAYEVVNSELARQKIEYEERIKSLTAQNEALTARIKALEDLVRGTKELETLAAKMGYNHSEITERLDAILKAVTSQ